jgi:hypothetical protein
MAVLNITLRDNGTGTFDIALGDNPAPSVPTIYEFFGILEM